MHDPVFHMRHTLTLLAGMNALGQVNQADLADGLTDLAENLDLIVAERGAADMVTLPVMTLEQLPAQARQQPRLTLVEGGRAS